MIGKVQNKRQKIDENQLRNIKREKIIKNNKKRIKRNLFFFFNYNSSSICQYFLHVLGYAV